MVSHQCQIGYTEVSDTTKAEVGLAELCIGHLIRAQTAISERQQLPTKDAHMLSQIQASNLPNEDGISRQASLTHAPNNTRNASPPIQGILAGSMYWEKVAWNRVYPKWATDCKSEKMFPQPIQQIEEKGEQDLDEFEEEMGNLQLIYDSDGEDFDCDISWMVEMSQ